MPRFRSTSTLVLAGALGALVGWLAGRGTGSAARPPPTPTVAPATAPASRFASDAPADSGARTHMAPLPAEAAAAAWAGLVATAPSPARDRECADLLSDWARHDPLAAVEQAEAEPNRRRRTGFLHAALRGWAATDATAAAAWAQQCPPGEREAALAAVLSGAAEHPEVVAALGRRLCAEEPALARERGFAVIGALADQGAFARAADFAGDGEADFRDAWLQNAYARWAESRPEDAALAALRLPDAHSGRLALEAVVVGWSQTEPASLAEFAVRLPGGVERGYALGEALRQWIDQDPVAASQWLDRLDPGPELDGAVASIATQPFLATRHPDVAVSWAESIIDAQLRSVTLAHIIQDWSTQDRAAALRFVETTDALRSEERADLRRLLGDPSGS